MKGKVMAKNEIGLFEIRLIQFVLQKSLIWPMENYLLEIHENEIYFISITVKS